ncbi:hypothetical protein B0T24DRAFT_675406 [Lasiosphaeria ovina]|uniref:Uncharacterized protein n=1 Tax=Lasiosphaeria ovina TaxID=92902 RepID=A0AAE0TSG0_9PEZI|nr:hypothetical protein B0T24DRAFT_675406 [Lasiosphaeria ovina]
MQEDTDMRPFKFPTDTDSHSLARRKDSSAGTAEGGVVFLGLAEPQADERPMVVLGGSPVDATVHARQEPSPSPEHTVIQTIIRSSTTQVATATLAAGFPATPAPSSDGVGITRAQVEIIVGVLVGVGGFICILLCCCFRSVRRNGWSQRPRHRHSRRKRDSDGSGDSPYRRPPSIANNYWDNVPLRGEDPIIRPPPRPVFPHQTGMRAPFPAPPSPPPNQSNAERSRSPSRSPPNSLSTSPSRRPEQRPERQPAPHPEIRESARKPDKGGKSGGEFQPPPTQQRDGDQVNMKPGPMSDRRQQQLRSYLTTTARASRESPSSTPSRPTMTRQAHHFHQPPADSRNKQHSIPVSPCPHTHRLDLLQPFRPSLGNTPPGVSEQARQGYQLSPGSIPLGGSERACQG